MKHTNYGVTKIAYDYYSDDGVYLERRVYCPTNFEDYHRVFDILKTSPWKYRLINCEYGYFADDEEPELETWI